MPAIFRDRVDAGQQLGQRIALRWREENKPANRPTLVLGLPRGGVVVAAEIARAINAPLDVLIVRKIGAPYQPELGIGAVADVEGRPEIVLNEDLLRGIGVDDAYVRAQAMAEHRECQRRMREYRGDRAEPVIHGADVIVVDDGIATGATVKAALQVVQRQAPHSLTLAVPVAPNDALCELQPLVSEIVCLASPPMFSSVGQAYAEFEQTNDQEVISLLRAATET
jgi:predicted phosphoribosyltransferase